MCVRPTKGNAKRRFGNFVRSRPYLEPMEARGTLPESSKWYAVLEIALVLLMFLADARHLVPFSKTLFLLLLAWLSLRVRHRRWRDVGLKRWKSIGKTIGIGVGIGALLEAFQLLALQPLLVRLTGKEPDISVFRPVIGNVKLLALGILLAWILAGFGEEAVYRGYLMNRVADVGNRTRAAWIVSLVLVSVLFGFAHSYQGMTGVIEEGLAGLLLGLVYLGFGRNLTLPIIAHGVQDTIDAVLIYLGHYRGL